MFQRGVILYDMNLTLLAIISIVVPLRLYVRIGMRRAFGLDDIALVVGWALCSAHLIVPLCEPTCNVRADLSSLSPSGTENNLRCLFIAQLFYVPATGIVKISFCLSLLRLLFDRWKQWFIYGLMIMVSVITLFYFLWLALDCNPVAYFWQRPTNPDGGSCKTEATFLAGVYASAAVILFADLSLAMLPVFIVKDLQMNWKLKLSVVAILGIGSLPSVATIARISLASHVGNTPDITKFLDILTKFVIWSNVESGASIISVSATGLRPLAERICFLSRPRETQIAPTSSGEGIHLDTLESGTGSRKLILGDKQRSDSLNTMHLEGQHQPTEEREIWGHIK